jgi:energy-coupling factor transporter ATP-binding protein EcfA2
MIALQAEGIPATPAAVLGRVLINATSDQQAAEYQRQFEMIRNYRTREEDITFLAFNLRDWSERALLRQAMKEALQVLEAPELATSEAYVKAMKIISAAAPRTNNIRTLSDDFLSNHKALQDWRLERARSGLSTGPEFPWDGLNELTGPLKPGELVAFLAKSGYGKTTIAQLIAIHMAHTLGYDVVYFHLETSPEALADRYISSKLKVLTSALRNPSKDGQYGFDHLGKHKKVYDAALAEWETRQATKGRITYKHAPKILPSIFKAEVEYMATEAAARGRELVVILDYYTEMDWSELPGANGNMYTGYSLLADYTKFVAETTKTYMVAFAQYGVDEDYATKKAGFGSQKINQRAQVVIQVERQEKAGSDYIIPAQGSTKEQFKQMVDLLGMPMFYHREGENDSRAIFRTTKVNEGQLGAAPILYVNAYGLIFDNPNGLTDFPNEKKRSRKSS